jgi:hypothetical protein
MPEIVGERVTRVWRHGLEKFGAEDYALRHMREWVLAVTAKRGFTRKPPPVELIHDDRGEVVGVRYVG